MEYLVEYDELNYLFCKYFSKKFINNEFNLFYNNSFTEFNNKMIKLKENIDNYYSMLEDYETIIDSDFNTPLTLEEIELITTFESLEVDIELYLLIIGNFLKYRDGKK